MRGQHHMVEMLGALVGGHAHACGVALDAAHGGVQALVGHAGQDFFDVVAGAAGHRPPLGPVGHLDQAVVVAEADHRCHRKLQHLVRRAAPDAAQHGQEVPVAEGVAKAVFLQKVAQRLHQRLLGMGLGDAGAQLVEAQQVGQHAPEAGVDQVAALGEHGREVGAAPLQCLAATRARHLHRERHVRLGRGHAQLGQQGDQVGVGALVEDQKARVHPVGDGLARRVGQGHIHRVGVAAKVAAGFKQGDLRLAAQLVRHRKPGDAGADDGDFHGRPPLADSANKKVAKHPETNKRGREEKRSRRAVGTRGTERLRNVKPGEHVPRSCRG